VDIVGFAEIFALARDQSSAPEQWRIGCMLAGRTAQDCATAMSPVGGMAAAQAVTPLIGRDI